MPPSHLWSWHPPQPSPPPRTLPLQDSFILAFHTPLDAVTFASSAQLSLLEQHWPADLLRLPQACEVAMAPGSK